MQVYDAAASLAKYIETEDFKKRCLDGNLAGKQLIEIGAGTGVVGLVAAHYGADSLLTDMESLVPLINYNIEKNQHILTGKAVGQTLCWGDQETYGSLPHPDFLVLANCVYYEGSLDQLAQTVDTLSGSKTVVLACYEERSKDISKLLQKWHELIGQKFSVTPVPADNLGLANVESFVRIVIMRRK